MSYRVNLTKRLNLIKWFFLRKIIWIANRSAEWASGYSGKPVCPYCGAECSTEVREMSFDGDVEEIDCGLCEQTYERHLSLEFSFATEKVES